MDAADPRYLAAAGAWHELKNARSEHEQDWEELARLINTKRGGFVSADPAEHRREKPLSASALIAQENFSSGLYGTLTNPANRWMSLEVTDDELGTWQPMREWLDLVSTRILRSFANSPFYSAVTQLYADASSFGNAAQYDEIPAGESGVLDVTVSLAEICYDIDGFGRVAEVVRRFELSAVQAARKFGYDALPAKLQERADKGVRDKAVFYHHVTRNDAWRKGEIGPRGKRWNSIYCSEVGQACLRHRGFDEMPFLAPRWEVDTGQTYGRGPGWIALPDARKLELMERANLRGGQRAADPTILAPNRGDWPLDGKVRPGSVVYGGVDFRGQQLLRTLDTYSGTGLTLEMGDRAVENIRDAFHWSLMTLAGRTGMTATEVMERSEEKLRLMAPHLGRLQEEYLAPKVARRFSLLWKAGQIPPPPEEAAGAELFVSYTSAAAMAQKSIEGAATSRLLQDLAPLAQIRPQVMDRIDDDAYVETMAEARGTPARLLRSRDEAEQIRQARAQQEQARAALEAAQGGAGAVRDLAQAASAGAPA